MGPFHLFFRSLDLKLVAPQVRAQCDERDERPRRKGAEPFKGGECTLFDLLLIYTLEFLLVECIEK